MPTPNKHAFLSASSAHRWLACTAAPHFEENFPDGTSTYAEEGTLAHAICELYARKKFTVMSTRKFNSELKKLQAQPLYQDEMLRTAEAYVEYLTEKAMSYTATPYVAMEVKVALTDYIPDGFGTCDCIMVNDSLELYQQTNKRLHRQGQPRPVIVHHLLVQGGTDEDVIKSLNGKADVQDGLLEALKIRIRKAKEAAT